MKIDVNLLLFGKVACIALLVTVARSLLAGGCLPVAVVIKHPVSMRTSSLRSSLM